LSENIKPAAAFLTAFLIFGLAGQCAEMPDEILRKAGKAAESFYRELPFYACTERVMQEKIGITGAIVYRQKSVFDYLIIAKLRDGELMIEESRLEKKKPRANSGKPSLLNTNGFPSLSLIFHPLYWPNYEFRNEGEVEEGAGLQRISFQHIPGTDSTSALALQGKIYPLDLQGMAEIDSGTGAIVKISADLVSPMKSINIESFHVEVEYRAEIHESDSEFRRLPSKTVVEIRTALQKWRNTHLFSNYKRFYVFASEAISK
jgi:hypothetical protein